MARCGDKMKTGEQFVSLVSCIAAQSTFLSNIKKKLYPNFFFIKDEMKLNQSAPKNRMDIY